MPLYAEIITILCCSKLSIIQAWRFLQDMSNNSHHKHHSNLGCQIRVMLKICQMIINFSRSLSKDIAKQTIFKPMWQIYDTKNKLTKHVSTSRLQIEVELCREWGRMGGVKRSTSCISTQAQRKPQEKYSD